MNKPLYITIDTEGDNLWSRPNPNSITTENALYIPRFQTLCEEYGLIPTWLTNYEMIHDDRLVNYLKPKVNKGKCMIGMHLYACNTPPIYNFNNIPNSTAAFITEYPNEVMYEKALNLKNDIENAFEKSILVHRSGRWSLNDSYIKILYDIGIRIDCTITPGVDWSSAKGITVNSFGSNYKAYKNGAQRITIDNNCCISEYPVTIIERDKYYSYHSKSIIDQLKSVYHFLNKRKVWLRPNKFWNNEEMRGLLDYIRFSDVEYAEFMIHSSELMPGGSPNFRTGNDIEHLYMVLDDIFSYAIKNGFSGGVFKY